MKKGAKRVLGAVAITAGAVGAIGAVLMKTSKRGLRRRRLTKREDQWARPGMQVIFRAELMPGRDASERTFRVKNLLPSGRVLLDGVVGEHVEKEFEPIRELRT